MSTIIFLRDFDNNENRETNVSYKIFNCTSQTYEKLMKCNKMIGVDIIKMTIPYLNSS